MNSTLRIMIAIYKPRGIDWLGFKITKKNPYSYHHCFKQVYGDYSDFDREYLLHVGAILSVKGQDYIHALEEIDYDAFRALNHILLEQNQTMKPPTFEYFQKVKTFLEHYPVHQKK